MARRAVQRRRWSSTRRLRRQLGDTSIAEVPPGRLPRQLLESIGAPLFGIEFLADRKVETRAFLTGLVLAGFMDDWSYRETSMLEHRRTFAGLPFHIGGGESAARHEIGKNGGSSRNGVEIIEAHFQFSIDFETGISFDRWGFKSQAGIPIFSQSQ